MLRSETAANPALRTAALAGLRRYQTAARPPAREERPIVAQAGRAVVRDHGGDGPPALFVPSLINPPFILDLAHDNSLLRWIAGRGSRALLVDWGSPGADESALSVADHVEQLLLPLIDSLGEPPRLVGYCLGGTMALAAAVLRPVRSLALIAAPWRFAGYPPQARAELAELWRAAEPGCRGLGVVPIEVLQSAFWRLDPARTVRKFAAFAAMAQDSAEARAFVALEDWANGGAPLTYAAGREAFEDLFGSDLTGERRWVVAGKPIDPGALACPTLELVSTRDRITPAATAAAIGERRAVDAGHVGMVVGSAARPALWDPLAAWLTRA